MKKTQQKIFENSDFIDFTIDSIRDKKLIDKHDKILLGLSGGPDSVFLFFIFLTLQNKLQFTFAAAHFNHMLREEESDLDAQFVKKLCEDFEISCYFKEEDVLKYKSENKLNLEEAARILRYDFFEEIAQDNKFNKIATAHNKNDVAELVLMNLLRGAGKDGLSGMIYQRKKILRPILFLEKKDILNFLDNNKINYRLDSSNLDLNFSRNKIRAELIPFIEKNFNPKIVNSLFNFSQITEDENNFLDKYASKIFDKHTISSNSDKITISKKKFKKYDIAIQRRILRFCIEKLIGTKRRISFLHIGKILEIINKDMNKSINLPNFLIFMTEYDELIFSREKIIKRNFEIKIDSFDDTVKINDISLKISSFEKKDKLDFSNNKIAYFDIKKISFPLIIRNVREKDFFYPLGAGGKKKVKKFFIDKKIKKEDRAKAFVVTSLDKIMWLAPHQISEEFKLDDKSFQILKLECFT